MNKISILVLSILSVMFFMFAVLGYSAGHHDEAVVHFEIAAVIGVISFTLRKGMTKSGEFLAWVNENIGSIKNGTAMYRGRHITLDTEITQFQACISLLLFSTRLPSGFYIKGQDNSLAAGLVFTIISLMLGWWGIPWGPVFTIHTLIKNLMGGHKQTIGELVKTIESEAPSQEIQPDLQLSPA